MEQTKELKDKVCLLPTASLCAHELRDHKFELSSGSIPSAITPEEIQHYYGTQSEPIRSGKIAYSTIVKSVCSKNDHDRVPIPPYNIHVVELGPEMQSQDLAKGKNYFLEMANKILSKSRPMTPMSISFCTGSIITSSGEECDPAKRHATTLIGSRRNCCGTHCVEEWLIQDSSGMRGWHNAELIAESMVLFGGRLTYVKNCGGTDQEKCTSDIQGPYPLHYLIETKDLSAAKKVLNSEGMVFEKDSYGRTPAHLAVLYGDSELIGMTSSAGFIEDKDHKTPIQKAIEFGRTDFLDHFLSNPKIKDTFFPREFDHLIKHDGFYYSLLEPEKEVTRHEEEEDETTGLKKITSYEVNVINTEKKSKFAKSLAHILKMEEAQRFLKLPENKRGLETLVSWLLLWATHGKYAEILQGLAKVDPNMFSQLDQYQRSLLDWAVQNGDLPSVQALLSVQSGKDTLKIADNEGEAPFHWFSWSTGGNKEVLKEMASHLDPREDMFLKRNHKGITPIQRAFNCHNLVPFLSVLLEQRNSLSSNKFEEITKTLTEKNSDGENVLERALRINCRDSIPLFKQLGFEVPDLPEPSSSIGGPIKTKTIHLMPAPAEK